MTGGIQTTMMTQLQKLLGDLRRSLIIVTGVILFASALAYSQADLVIARLHDNGLPSVVFLVPAEAFSVRVKISLLIGLVASMPVMLWQASRLLGRTFRVPVSRRITLLMMISYALFLLGVAFGYRYVLPNALRFFLSFSSDVLEPMITCSGYVSFVAGVTLPFGFAFQLPVVVGALAQAGVITYQAMRRNRGYVVVGTFCLAAVLTPADVFSQIALAIPLIILFEISTIIAWLVRRKPLTPARRESRRRSCRPPS